MTQANEPPATAMDGRRPNGPFPYRRRLPNGRYETVLFEGTPEECDAWESAFKARLADMRENGGVLTISLMSGATNAN